MAESARLRDRLSTIPIWWLLGVIVLTGAVAPYYTTPPESVTVIGQAEFILGVIPWLLDRPLRLLATIVAVPFVLPTKPY